jgi:hypothetical protein
MGKNKDDNAIKALEKALNDHKNSPYLKEEVKYMKFKYNPDYGDDRVCVCGHVYYRHFDTYEEMEPVGCKYCGCSEFVEEPDTRLRHLSRQGRENVLISDYVGLKITWEESGGDPALGNTDGDWKIECPDFLDHDEELMYLYDKDFPYNELKFSTDWNWLIPVVKLIYGDLTSEGERSQWDMITKIWSENKAFANNNKKSVFMGVVRFLQYRKKYGVDRSLLF